MSSSPHKLVCRHLANRQWQNNKSWKTQASKTERWHLAFLTFYAFTNQPLITGLGGRISVEEEGDIHLTCKSLDGKSQILILNKVQYMSGVGLNLISQG